MEDKEVYDKLNKERPIIIYKLLNFAVSMHSAEALARRVSDHRDSPELRDLIEAAARYIKDGQS